MKIPALFDQLVENPRDPALQRQLQEWLPGADEEGKRILRTYQEFESLQPRIFTIETVMACNLHCPECAIGGGITSRDKRLLSYEDYLKLAERIRGHAEYLYLHLWGEPFLNKDILRMVRHASAFTRVNLSTNAMLIKDESIPEIVASGLADIIFSIDGMSQEVYEKYRVGGKVDVAFSKLAKFAEENRRAGNPVGIHPQFIAFAHNEHEMGAFQEFCRSIGLEPAFKAPYIRVEDSKFRPSSHPSLQRPSYGSMDSLLEAISGCPSPRRDFTMDADGNVILCCHDFDSSVRFGNLFQQDLPTIWNSPEYRRARWGIMTRRPPGFCTTGCMSYSLAKGVARTAPAALVGTRINLCGGSAKASGWTNIDLDPAADIRIDLEKELLPFADRTVDAVVCMSAINYFERARAREILRDVHRVLVPGGWLRLGTQDLRVLARKYLDRDEAFLLEKLPDGRDRFPGPTMADKFCNWFYGFVAQGKPCRYVYDAESLSLLLVEAGFEQVRECRYRESEFPGMESFDNRPEQMFYLEATKPAQVSVAAAPRIDLRAAATQLWKENRLEQAWQLVSEMIRAPDCSEIDGAWALSLARQLTTPEHLSNLTKELAQRFPGPVFEGIHRDVEAQVLEGKRKVIRDPRTVEDLVRPDRKEKSDAQRLQAALAWLLKSEAATGGRGSSALYDFELGTWGCAYPETTGYIIPTLLRASETLREPEYGQAAVRMGEWILSILQRDGALGEPLGIFHKNPRVFNTGQALLGMVSLARSTGREDFLVGARRLGDWLCSVQDPDGKWSRSTYAGPRPYHVRCAWALLALHETTQDFRYRDAAQSHLGWLMSQALPNGCFRGNSLTTPDQPWTHLIGYVLYGLEELLLVRRRIGLDEHPAANSVLRSAATNLVRLSAQARADGLPSFHATYDLDWNPTDRWSCLTGNAQLSHFLTNSGWWFSDNDLRRAGRSVLGPTAELQFLDRDGEEDLQGGLPGCYPLGGGYLSHQIPNWGVKFFADAILELEYPNRDRILLLG